MTLPAPVYDLTLLLDLQAEEPARAKALADARASIEARGELIRHDEWGERPLAYPILRRKSAEYHLLQFHTADNELLSGLERTLHITDGVLRFRLIKLRPGVPAPPDMRSGAAPAAAPRRAESERGDALAPGEPAAVGTDAEAATPAEAAVPAEAATPSETAVPAEAAVDAEAATPAEAAVPAEAATPAEAAVDATAAEAAVPAVDGEAPALQEPAQA
jgi:small subunit ribosomal protein S6